jgi:hypothetical protein
VAIKKPGIPTVPNKDIETYNVLSTLKETVEILTGVRGGTIDPLASNASTAQIISKINEIITKLNV